MGPAELPDLCTLAASEWLKGEGAFRPGPLTKGQASNCSPSPFHLSIPPSVHGGFLSALSTSGALGHLRNEMER